MNERFIKLATCGGRIWLRDSETGESLYLMGPIPVWYRNA